MVGSDQQMQKLEESELRKADRTVGVNCNIFYFTLICGKCHSLALCLLPDPVRGFYYFKL